MSFSHGAVVGEAEAAEPTQKAVLVTGASTGLGRAIAERLATEGYLVFAGARKKADLDALDAIENIRAIRLDVTVDEEVEAAHGAAVGASATAGKPSLARLPSGFRASNRSPSPS